MRCVYAVPFVVLVGAIIIHAGRTRSEIAVAASRAFAAAEDRSGASSRTTCIVFVPGLQCHKYDAEARARNVFGGLADRLLVVCDAGATRALTAVRCVAGATAGWPPVVETVVVAVARELGAGNRVVLIGRSHGGRIVSRAVQALCASGIDLSRLHAQTYGSTLVPNERDTARADLTHVFAAGDVASRCRRDLYRTSLALIGNWRALRRPGEDDESATPTTFPDPSHAESGFVRWFIPTLDEATMDLVARGHGPALVPPHVEHVLHDHKAYTKLAVAFAADRLGTGFK